MAPMAPVRTSVIAALVLAFVASTAPLACSDPAPRPPAADSAGPGVLGSGGGGGDASVLPVSDAGSGDAGLVCSALDLVGTSFVDVQTLPGALPTAQGGAVEAGTYVLVDAAQYGASVGGPSGISLRDKLVFALNGTSGTFERVGDTGPSTQQRTSATASGALEVLPSGSSFTLLPGCPSARTEGSLLHGDRHEPDLYDARALASYTFQKR